MPKGFTARCARTSGTAWASCASSTSTSILNLLPIPVLDGGLILFAFIALVFRHRLPDWFVTNVSLGFMVLLMGLMAILIFRDGVRSFKIHTYKPEEAQTQNVHEKPDAQP